MFELYGINDIDTINKDRIGELIKKYTTVKGAIIGRKKRKLNKNCWS